MLHVGELLGLGGSLGSKGGIALVVALLESSSDGIKILLAGWFAVVLGEDIGIVLGVRLLEGLGDGLQNLLAGWLVLSSTGGPSILLARFQARKSISTYFSEVTCLRVERVASRSS